MKVGVGTVLTDNRALRAALKGVRRIAPPSGLTTTLLVMASRERRRAAERNSVSAFCRAWMDRTRLMAHNLMQPLALPFAGGVFSALVLFGAWVVPAYPVLAHGGKDVPTNLSTSASVKLMAPIGMSNADMVVDVLNDEQFLIAPPVDTQSADIVVDVLIDEQGRMTEYSMVSGTLDASSRRSLENMLMFTEFVPATAFGQPGVGRLRVWLNARRVEVKG